MSVEMQNFIAFAIVPFACALLMYLKSKDLW